MQSDGGKDSGEGSSSDDDVTSTSSSSAPIHHQYLHRLPREVRDILAGGMAGMVAKSVIAPLNRIKILFQVSSSKFSLRGVAHVARSIVTHEGASALWKGNTATLIRVFPYSGIQFMVYNQCKTKMLIRHEQLQAEAAPHSNISWGMTPLESLEAGMIAGAVSVAMTYPLDLVRSQLSVLRQHSSAKQNIGFVALIKENYQARGIRSGLFRGIGPTLMGILPYSGIAFLLNEQGKRQIQLLQKRDLTTTERMQCGALSGLLAQFAAYPFEMTRRRMQTIGVIPTSGENAAVSFAEGTSSGIKETTIDVAKTSRRPKSKLTTRTSTVLKEKAPTLQTILKDLYREQGIRGFYKGLSMNWVKGPVAFSISFTLFDVFQGLMSSDEETQLRREYEGRA